MRFLIFKKILPNNIWL